MTNYLNKIEEIDQKLSEAWDKHEIALDDVDRALDVLNSVKHQQDVSVKLSVYEKAVMSSTLAAQNASNKELVSALTQAQATPGRNLIKCERFDGGSSDKFEFKYWLSQFESMLASGRAISGTSKLSVLRNHLTHSGLAFKTISHLDINDDNYDEAIKALKEEFLDIEHIVHETFKQILDRSPRYDPEFENLRLYVAEIKSLLNDLKKILQN